MLKQNCIIYLIAVGTMIFIGDKATTQEYIPQPYTLAITDSSNSAKCLTKTTLSDNLQFADIDRARKILGRSDEWVRQLSAALEGMNVTIPDEIMAENFALLMEWRYSGTMPESIPGGPGEGFPVNDKELLREIEKILTAGCEE
jgi:hypothetical protein